MRSSRHSSLLQKKRETERNPGRTHAMSSIMSESSDSSSPYVVVRRRQRQSGQVGATARASHRSRQLRWKRWRHLSSLISSPSSMQLRQNTHSTASSSSSLQQQLLLLLVLMTLPTARLLSAESCRNDVEPLVGRHANVLRLRAATTSSTDIGGRRIKSAALMDAMTDHWISWEIYSTQYSMFQWSSCDMLGLRKSSLL
jgi:hypothetical protein